VIPTQENIIIMKYKNYLSGIYPVDPNIFKWMKILINKDHASTQSRGITDEKIFEIFADSL